MHAPCRRSDCAKTAFVDSANVDRNAQKRARTTRRRHRRCVSPHARRTLRSTPSPWRRAPRRGVPDPRRCRYCAPRAVGSPAGRVRGHLGDELSDFRRARMRCGQRDVEGSDGVTIQLPAHATLRRSAGSARASGILPVSRSAKTVPGRMISSIRSRTSGARVTSAARR